MNDPQKHEELVAEEIRAEVEERVTKGVTTAITVLISVVITFVVSIIVFKFVWAWVVPDLFPGAVAEGLISANLTWLAALKLAVLSAVLTGFGPALNEAFKTRP